MILKRELSRGTVGLDVRALQRELRLLGYEIDLSERQLETFGQTTEEAVRAFQGENGLSPSGRVDSRTTSRLNDAVRAVSTYRVRGRVLFADGSAPPIGVALSATAYDVDLRTLAAPPNAPGEQLGALASVGADGGYEITYTPPSPPLRETWTPDILVRIASVTGPPVDVDSEIYYNAPADVAIDIMLPGPAPSASTEFERMRDAIQPLLPVSTAFPDLTTSDQDFVAHEAELDPVRIGHFVRAHQWQQQNSVLLPEALYGLFRKDMPSESRELLAGRGQATLRRALEAAIAEEIIPEVDIEAVLSALFAVEQDAFLGTAPAAGMATWQALFNASSLLADATLQQRFAEAWLSNTKPVPEFWTALAGSPWQFPANFIAEFQYTLQLATLSGRFEPLVGHFLGNGKPSLAALAEQPLSYWTDIVGGPTGDGSDGTGFPPFITEMGVEGVERYVTALRKSVEDAYPSVFAAHEVKRDTLIPLASADRDAIATFASAHTDFDFRKTNVDFYAAHLPSNPPDDELKGHLKRVQRVLRLTERYEEAAPLLRDGIHSAHEAVALGREGFVAEYGGAMGDERARRVYEQAQRRVGAAVQLFAILAPVFNVGPGGHPREALAERVANYTALFGSLDYCDCAHCRSVYSPSAYLVELLQLLEKQKVQNVPGANTAREVLFLRRKDIGQIELSCENTETPIPYIDLVNEVLEFAAAKRSFPSHIATRGVAEELRANPDVIDPVTRDAVYDRTLPEAVYPWALPFSLPAEVARAYSDHLGVPRTSVMEALRPDEPDFRPRDVAIAAESLGLTPNERRLISGGLSVTHVAVASTAAVSDLAATAAIDGRTIKYGDRVLLKNQAAGAQIKNGIYRRAISALEAEPNQAPANVLILVDEGPVNDGKAWFLDVPATPTFQSMDDPSPGDLTVVRPVKAVKTGPFSQDLPEPPFIDGVEIQDGDRVLIFVPGDVRSSIYRFDEAQDLLVLDEVEQWRPNLVVHVVDGTAFKGSSWVCNWKTAGVVERLADPHELEPAASVRLATTTSIDLVQAPATVDGRTLLAGDRLLVKDQSPGAAHADHGVYRFASAGGALIAVAVPLPSGQFVFVEEGATQAGSRWVADAPGNPPTTLRFTPLCGGLGPDCIALVKAATTTNINLLQQPPPDVDDQGLQNDDLVLVKDQKNAAENGIYRKPANNGPLVLVPSPLAAHVGNFVRVTGGAVHAGTNWAIVETGASKRFARLPPEMALDSLAAVSSAAFSNVDLSADAGAVEGVALDSIRRVLLAMQDTASENGIYVPVDVGGGIKKWRRAADFQDGADVHVGQFVFVEGELATHKNTRWVVSRMKTIGTDDVRFAPLRGNGRIGPLAPVAAATTENVVIGAAVPAFIDGIATAANQRILVRNQANSVENGIYTVTNNLFARALDADASAKLLAGMFVYVKQGTVHGGKRFVVARAGKVGTERIEFETLWLPGTFDRPNLPGAFFGTDTTAGAPAFPASSPTVRDLLTRCDLTYDALTRLLRSRFLNPGAEAHVVFAEGKPCDLSAASIEPATPSLWNRLHRFVRLQRKLGWTIGELDLAIRALRPAELTDGLMEQLAAVKALRGRWKLPLPAIAALYADLDTEPDETGESFYDRLFLNRGVLNPVNHAFALDSLRLELRRPDRSILTAPEEQRATILGALGIEDEELRLLVASGVPGANQVTDRMSLSNLSQLYRTGMLARTLGLSIADFIELRSHLSADPFDRASPKSTIAFLESAEKLRTAGIAVEELSYLLRSAARADSTVSPTGEALALALGEVRDGLRKISLDLGALPKPFVAPQGAANVQVQLYLEVLLDPAKVATASAIIARNSALSIPMQKAFVDESFGFLGAAERAEFKKSLIEDPESRPPVPAVGVNDAFAYAASFFERWFNPALPADPKGALTARLAKELLPAEVVDDTIALIANGVAADVPHRSLHGPFEARAAIQHKPLAPFATPSYIVISCDVGNFNGDLLISGISPTGETYPSAETIRYTAGHAIVGSRVYKAVTAVQADPDQPGALVSLGSVPAALEDNSTALHQPHPATGDNAFPNVEPLLEPGFVTVTFDPAGQWTGGTITVAGTGPLGGAVSEDFNPPQNPLPDPVTVVGTKGFFGGVTVTKTSNANGTVKASVGVRYFPRGIHFAAITDRFAGNVANPFNGNLTLSGGRYLTVTFSTGWVTDRKITVSGTRTGAGIISEEFLARPGATVVGTLRFDTVTGVVNDGNDAAVTASVGVLAHSVTDAIGAVDVAHHLAESVLPALGVPPGEIDGIKRDLIDSTASSVAVPSTIAPAPHPRLGPTADRFSLVLRSLLPFVARRRSEALVKQKLASILKIEPKAVEALLPTITYGVGNESSAKERLLEATFVRSVTTPPVRVDLLKNQFAVLVKLEKAAGLVARFQISSSELSAWTSLSQIPSWLDLDLLPALVSDSAVPFVDFERFIDYLGLRSRLPKRRGGWIDVYSAAYTNNQNDDYALFRTVVLELTDWNEAQFDTLFTELALVKDPAVYKDERTLARLKRCFDLAARVGTDVRRLIAWREADLPLAVADEIKQAAKSKYERERWLEIAGPIEDRLRERRRDALLAYVGALRGATQSPKTRLTSDELFDHFLLDLEMSACQLTSRVKQAISSVQLFIQGILLQKEGQNVKLGDVATREWKEFLRAYRVWEANRKVFLYPENWIEPELRDDKTPFFKELESELLQSEVNEQNVETALHHYLEKLDQVARLEVAALYHQVDDQAKPSVDVTHVIARTQGSAQPRVHFYRRRIRDDYWTPWERIDFDIDGEHLLPIIFNRRLYLIWPSFTEGGDIDPKKDGESPGRYLDVRLSSAEYRTGKWQPRRMSTDRARMTSSVKGLVVRPEDISFRAFSGGLNGGLLVVRTGNPQCDFVMFGCNDVVAIGLFDEHGDGAVPFKRFKKVSEKVIKVELGTSVEEGRWHPQNVIGYFNKSSEDFDNQDPKEESLEQLNLVTWIDLLNPKKRIDTVAPLGATPGRYELVLPHEHLPSFLAWHDSFFFQDESRCYYITPSFPERQVDYAAIQVSPSSSSRAEDWLDLSDDEPVLPLKYTREWLATPGNLRFRFRPFFHPYSSEVIKRLNSTGIAAMLSPAVQKLPGIEADAVRPFVDTYAPVPIRLQVPWPREIVDFTFDGAYSQYNWELFFHAPLLIATRLSQNQRFEDAIRWFHFIFDPTLVPKPWNCRPFDLETELRRIDEILPHLDDDKDPKAKQDLIKQIEYWRANPFKPHVIARLRPVAYMKTVVMKYIDNLIAWADDLFRRDTLESINEATQLYILARRILGERPARLPARDTVLPKTYNELRTKHIDEFGNVLLEMENLAPFAPGANLDQLDVRPLGPSLYFCIPPNEKLLGYWDTVDDRLFKIRHCMNIEGVTRELPLFEPPIDPALLVRAAAAGVDINSVLRDLRTGLPHYRFQLLLQKAVELCNEVKSLGAELLAALEKSDAERIALLRSEHEIGLLKAVREVKSQQIEEARRNRETLDSAHEAIQQRVSHYTSVVPGGPKNRLAKEGHQEDALTAVLVLNAVQTGLESLATILHLFPRLKIGFVGPAPVAEGETGGPNIAGSLQSASAALGHAAGIASTQAQLSSIQAGYERRDDEWKLQLGIANADLAQNVKQKAAADIRTDITIKDLANHDTQIENVKSVDELMRSKFTNRDLYGWMIGQISATYFQTYQLAYDLAKKAERAFQFERGDWDTSFVKFGYWDNLKKGLLAGEGLLLDLRRMETAYLERNRREYELTKHVSLALLDPAELLRLRLTGRATMRLDERQFDLDYPGHTMRRIKSVGLTVACTVGQHAGVNCTLTLTKNRVRSGSTLKDGKYVETAPVRPGSDDRFVWDVVPIQSMATSSAQNDRGLFELNFRDERYLPFEGGGAISEWEIEILPETNPFDLTTIGDVLLHVNYTSRDGGGVLKQAALDEVVRVLPLRGVRGWSARHDFRDQAAQLFGVERTSLVQKLLLPLDADRFPLETRGRTVRLKALDVLVKFSDRPTGIGMQTYAQKYAAKPPLETWFVLGDATPVDHAPLAVDPVLGNVGHARFRWSNGRALGGWNVLWKSGESDETVSGFLNDLDDKLHKVVEGFDPETDFIHLGEHAVDDIWIVVQYEAT